MTVLDEALAMSRSGDVAGAVAALREARSAGVTDDATLTLLFQLLTVRGVDDEALDVASAGLTAAVRPISRSTWALRRGLAHLERGARAESLADLQLVLRLRANEGHVEQARAALLRVAALPK